MLVKVKLLFFAQAKDLAEKSTDTLVVPQSITCYKLLKIIINHSKLEKIENNILLAVNEEFCHIEDCLNLKDNDEIAVIPPLSGDIQQISNLVTAASCGAISVFIGTTRDNFDGKSVLNLEYEAYESMGIKAMEKICLDIRKQWSGVENIAIYHRLGQVPVKEASVVIAISSPHRDDALKATDFCINSLKQSVPIWKKEIYSDEESAWKENKESLLVPYPPKRKKLNTQIKQEVSTNYIPSHLIQIKATNDELNTRIEKYMDRKRDEINTSNNSEFFMRDRDMEFSCARIDAIVRKRKGSKSHLQVERALNSYHRDQNNSDYMKKYIPQNGINERLQILESQLSLEEAVPKNIYQRLKNLENRLLLLESISPEYLQFWDKTLVATKSPKKKIFQTMDIDELIADVEKKCIKK